MAIRFECSNPSRLLNQFKSKIALGNKSGGISTWKEDSDGDFTHVADQIAGKGYLVAHVTNAAPSSLSFYVKYYKNATTAERKLAFKELSGNLLATFIDHFGADFDQAVFFDARS